MPTVSEKRPTLEDVNKALDELNNAIIDHTKWVASWSRSAICHTPISDEYRSGRFSHECKFGQWYYSAHHDFLRENLEFITLEKLHDKMHSSVHQIINKISSGKTLPSSEYDTFLKHEVLFATALSKLRDDLLGLSHSYDYLTGTLNRQAFFQLLSQEHARIKRTSDFCCLMLVDIDYFKRVNDQYGHKAGDTVLRYIADFLNSNLRPYDLTCRFGGEEFLVCLPNTTVGIARTTIERLREKISQARIQIADDVEIQITASFGISLLSADEDWSIAIEHADEAMYQAKARGRNRVVVWRETFQE
ncbi:MAG: diguanylate cyclase [Candidatus Polarisedimenticolaceae bacterium]|nr:diguanylate cyclase [Candidatus Polarisedimenticolaceae bacterium]